jgi:hypothetical protein
MTPSEHLVLLGRKLEGFEIVPGLALPAPRFEQRWPSDTVLMDGIVPPDPFLEFVKNPGGIVAMDTAGGVAFMTPEQVDDNLRQDYGPLLRWVDGAPTFPFAVTGSGSYLLLALDDSAVWKFNVHMHPVATPIRIADGFLAFLRGLIADWEALLAGQGGPYSTS